MAYQLFGPAHPGLIEFNLIIKRFPVYFQNFRSFRFIEIDLFQYIHYGIVFRLGGGILKIRFSDVRIRYITGIR